MTVVAGCFAFTVGFLIGLTTVTVLYREFVRFMDREFNS